MRKSKTTLTELQIMPGFEQCVACKDELKNCVKVDGHWFCPVCLPEYQRASKELFISSDNGQISCAEHCANFGYRLRWRRINPEEAASMRAELKADNIELDCEVCARKQREATA